jgi:hypothetical protein
MTRSLRIGSLVRSCFISSSVAFALMIALPSVGTATEVPSVACFAEADIGRVTDGHEFPGNELLIHAAKG